MTTTWNQYCNGLSSKMAEESRREILATLENETDMDESEYPQDLLDALAALKATAKAAK